LPFVINSRGAPGVLFVRHTSKRVLLTLALIGLFCALVAPVSASASTSETYSMVGYEIYYAPDHGVFAGTGAGVDGPHELSAWVTDVYHTLSISPGNVTGGSASLQRIDGVYISGDFSGGDVVESNPGYYCTTETHTVTAQLVNVTRSDEPGAVGTAVMTATLTHYQALFWGQCINYSARVDATITVTV
jgi:hypothetical protein